MTRQQSTLDMRADPGRQTSDDPPQQAVAPGEKKSRKRKASKSKGQETPLRTRHTVRKKLIFLFLLLKS